MEFLETQNGTIGFPDFHGFMCFYFVFCLFGWFDVSCTKYRDGWMQALRFIDSSFKNIARFAETIGRGFDGNQTSTASPLVFTSKCYFYTRVLLSSVAVATGVLMAPLSFPGKQRLLPTRACACQQTFECLCLWRPRGTIQIVSVIMQLHRKGARFQPACPFAPNSWIGVL